MKLTDEEKDAIRRRMGEEARKEEQRKADLPYVVLRKLLKGYRASEYKLYGELPSIGQRSRVHPPIGTREIIVKELTDLGYQCVCSVSPNGSPGGWIDVGFNHHNPNKLSGPINWSGHGSTSRFPPGMDISKLDKHNEQFQNEDGVIDKGTLIDDKEK